MDELIKKEAISFIKSKANVRILIEKFANPACYISSDHPFTVFMAGSPGAGKTEYSKAFIEEMKTQDPIMTIVRIDADEIRELIPQYNGHNSCDVHAAASIGVEKLFDYVQDKSLSVVIDGTFASYEVSRKDILRAIGKNRRVGIKYLYQEPILAWKFTQIREKVEGRNITKDVFITEYLAAMENVNKAKQEFGNQIELDLIIKDYDNKLQKLHLNIDKVDSYVDNVYNRVSLEEIMK